MRLPLIALCSLAMPAMAGEFSLSQPIDCTLGETCFIQQYVDHDPGPGAQDFTCGALSYDGHKGTDFGLPSFQMMRNGVEVLAAAPGIVKGLRDGVPDTGIGLQTEGKECGNGLVIDHGSGWITQYCHLKRGSLRVRQGQRIETGTVLGQVGFSGQTQFPHLHLSLRKNGVVIDPFDPDGELTCGTPDEATLWAEAPVYTPGGLVSAGFSTLVPNYEAIKEGSAGAASLPADAPALVLWGYAFGGRAGDQLQFTIHGTDGPFFSTQVSLDKNQAQFFRATGKRRPAAGFPAGEYSGRITLIRDGSVLDQITVQTRIE